MRRMSELQLRIEQRTLAAANDVLARTAEGGCAFGARDVRAMVFPFEHCVNLARSGTHFVTRALNLEKGVFELRTLAFGTRCYYAIVAESLENFLGWRERGRRSRIGDELGGQVSCLYAWGANDQFQLGFEHTRPGQERRGLALVRFEHTYTQAQAERLWRLRAQERARERRHRREVREHLSLRQLVQSGLHPSSEEEPEDFEGGWPNLGRRRVQPPDFRHRLSRMVDYTFQIVEVQCGEDFAVARTNDGRLFSWGDNRDGRCGQGRRCLLVPAPRMLPVLNHGGRRVVQYSVGLRHVLCLTEGSRVFVWGAYPFVHLLRRDGAATDFYVPTLLPLDELLHPRVADKLELIQRREQYRYEALEPGFDFRELLVGRPEQLPRFDHEPFATNSFERLDVDLDGRLPDDDSEAGLARDPRGWREQRRLDQAAWDRRQAETAERRATRRALRAARREQVARRRARRHAHEAAVEALREEAYAQAVARYHREYDGLGADEIAAKAETDPSVLVTRTEDGVRVRVLADDFRDPPREPDSPDVIVPDDSETDDDPELTTHWNPVDVAPGAGAGAVPGGAGAGGPAGGPGGESGPGSNPEGGSEKGPREGLGPGGSGGASGAGGEEAGEKGVPRLALGEVRRQEKLNEGLGLVVGEHPPTFPPGRPRDAFRMSWRGVSPAERRWLELMAVVKRETWQVVRVEAGRGTNAVWLRAKAGEVKDVLLVWGRNDVGQLGVGRVSGGLGIAGKTADFGWFPVFLWFGGGGTLRDDAYKLDHLALGRDYAVACCRGWGDQQQLFLWGAFPVLGYNALRVDPEKEPKGPKVPKADTGKAEKAGPAWVKGLKKSEAKAETANKSPERGAEDPYDVTAWMGVAEDKTGYWVVGRAAFPFPVPILSPVLAGERITGVSCARGGYQVAVNTARGEAFWFTQFFLRVKKREGDGAKRIRDQRGQVFTPVPFPALWRGGELVPDLCSFATRDAVETRHTGYVAYDSAAVLTGPAVAKNR
ncbi:chromosome condensation regulator Rcc1 repeat protein [Gregarina niphandrodes]|uniref:Chromosome condensation regulator Rcc1 repeat protein n=1 Tax=Gregarina niphandrodes TaxID=110365 RepID=A0A023AZN0_GRENI|nr:chromosome condensation regulator Rcc1 repeat protein [Gregarina niphandrodes]EZG44232.1 chromosome condensation regulator Rcc1 repeat protein [Gregarina niphandrodes]|eukprot:XP_011132750.1 chromosome condensation regulator Rcc1 repeat protein [Gregarina niphandrodes]